MFSFQNLILLLIFLKKYYFFIMISGQLYHPDISDFMPPEWILIQKWKTNKHAH